MRRFDLRVVVASVLVLAVHAAAAPDFGMPVSEEELAAVDIDIAPDGRGLPPGSGTVADGIDIYMEKCVACHGPRGQGAAGGPALAGGMGSLNTPKAQKTVGSYWPHATTLFDYIRRAMPYDKPMTLSNDETYALTATVLWFSGIVRPTDVMNATTLPKVQMPNRDGFVDAWTPGHE
ncbi:MAG: c-type cytochrome [Burkholderiales bacterium]|nr:c-type cytochrome [Burkholderiales bacterium]